jgi:histone H3/H4
MEELADAATKISEENRTAKKPTKKILKSSRAGIIFPVTRTRRKLARAMPGRDGRVSEAASVFLSGALETITSDIFDIAEEKTTSNNRKRITPSDIQYAIDESNISTGSAYMRGATRVSRSILESNRIQELRRLQHEIIYGAKKKKAQTPENLKKSVTPIVKKKPIMEKPVILIREEENHRQHEPLVEKPLTPNAISTKKRSSHVALDDVQETKIPEKKMKVISPTQHSNLKPSTPKNITISKHGDSLSGVMRQIINSGTK